MSINARTPFGAPKYSSGSAVAARIAAVEQHRQVAHFLRHRIPLRWTASRHCGWPPGSRHRSAAPPGGRIRESVAAKSRTREVDPSEKISP